MRLRANVHRRICVHAHMRVSMRVGVNPLRMTAVCQNLLILCFHYHTANYHSPLNQTRAYLQSKTITQ